MDRFHFNNTPSLIFLTKQIKDLYRIHKVNLLNAATLYDGIQNIVNIKKTLDFIEFQRPNLSYYLYNKNNNFFKEFIDQISGLTTTEDDYYSAIVNFVKNNNILYRYTEFLDDIDGGHGSISDGAHNYINILNHDYLQLCMENKDDISAAIYLLLAPPSLGGNYNIWGFIINDFNKNIYSQKITAQK
jgi:hypothetical protein